MSNSADGLGLYVLRGFLGARECAALIEEVSAAWGGPATVYRPGAPTPVDERLRRTTRHMLSEETTERVRQMLLRRMDEVAAHFGVTLRDCEPPQFLRYREGDFFVAHQDGNTEQLQYDHLRVRRVSVVIFLNRQREEPAPDSFGGGSLVFYGPQVDPARKELGVPVAAEPGMLVAFRSETTHEVRPVTHGQRFSVVCWYR
ncbi:MAG TPA: 2OG-Fe(II) oxygenase [Pyrinomonadaceae bacterium]|nr:2OG-Fe(II) oxygenase [Pyrinomonadaceae bacterium]